MRWLGTLALFGLLLSVTFALHSFQENPLVEYTYYDLKGTTFDELCTSLQRDGPVDERGVVRVGATHWKFSWRWPPKDGLVQYANTEILSKITVLLPRWHESAQAPAELVQRWRVYEAALVAHEAQHAQFAADTSRQLNALFQSLPPHTPESEAEERAQRLLTALRARDARYDATTNHGRSEGVDFHCFRKIS